MVRRAATGTERFPVEAILRGERNAGSPPAPIFRPEVVRRIREAPVGDAGGDGSHGEDAAGLPLRSEVLSHQTRHRSDIVVEEEAVAPGGHRNTGVARCAGTTVRDAEHRELERRRHIREQFGRAVRAAIKHNHDLEGGGSASWRPRASSKFPSNFRRLNDGTMMLSAGSIAGRASQSDVLRGRTFGARGRCPALEPCLLTYARPE